MNQDIIDLYQSILLRTPAQEEIDYWLEHAENNSLQFVADAIRASDEGVHVQEVLLPIIGLYQGLLGRAPEIEGLEFWANAISNGDLTFQDLISGFVVSTEFQTNNPDLGLDVTPQELAALFYQNLLGREPDAAGLQFWAQLLADGDLTVDTFTTAFINTPETQSVIGEQIRDFLVDIQDGTVDNPDPWIPPEPSPDPDPDPIPDPDTGGGTGGGGGTPPPPDPEPDVSTTVGLLDAIAQGQNADESPNGIMLSNNSSANDFAITRIDFDNDGVDDIELGLGAQARLGVVAVPEEGVVTFANGVGNGDNTGVPTFKFSVSSLDGVNLETLLSQYDVKMLVDTDDTAGTNFIELTAVADTVNGGVDWTFKDWDSIDPWVDGNSAPPKLTDDGGDQYVSQNIQALGWYQPFGPDGNRLFNDYESNEGSYEVILAVYEKGGVDIVGSTSLVFNIGALDVG